MHARLASWIAAADCDNGRLRHRSVQSNGTGRRRLVELRVSLAVKITLLHSNEPRTHALCLEATRGLL